MIFIAFVELGWEIKSYMKEDNNIYKDTLKIISNVIDEVKYECEGREYTLSHDEMSQIFFCRDLAQKILMSDES